MLAHKPHGRIVASKAASALATALTNPYEQQHGWLSASSHPKLHQWKSAVASPRQTADGYTLSSTYSAAEESVLHQPLPEPHETSICEEPSRPVNQIPCEPPRLYWLKPGNHPCYHPGCSFKASLQSVEIHMMDRHLIYPKNWKEERHWDADISLKGKTIPVTGTSIILNTPQAIDDWISERRKKWPTTQRVEEKAARRLGALERGELEMDSLVTSSKRRKIVTPHYSESASSLSQRYQKSNSKGTVQPSHQTSPIMATSILIVGSDISDDNGDGPPEDFPTKGRAAVRSSDIRLPESKETKNYDNKNKSQGMRFTRHHDSSQFQRPKGGHIINERRPLLRSLLLPEIRHSVSNLSQVIHFIVENGFFDGFELHPGDAQSQAILVLYGKVTNEPSVASIHHR